MSWQDLAISGIQLALSGALLPALFSSQKPDRVTCALNTVLLFALAGVMLSMSMFFSAGTGSAVAVCWLVLLLQERAS